MVSGSSVAVSLTDYGTANLGRLLGMGVGTVEGNLVSVSDSAYTLTVQVVRQRNGIETFWRGEQVAIPRTDVAEIRQRRFSRSKSALATVAVLAAAFGAVWFVPLAPVTDPARVGLAVPSLRSMVYGWAGPRPHVPAAS